MPPLPAPPPRPVPPWASGVGVAGLLLTGFWLAAALVAVIVGLWQSDVLRTTEAEGEPVVVERSWEDRYFRGRAGYATVRYADGRSATARFDRELLPRIEPGLATRAWPMPEEPSMVYLAEALEETRDEASIVRVIAFVLAPLFLLGGALAIRDHVRRRRLYTAGIATPAELIDVAPGKIRYRYRTPQGFDVEGVARHTPEQLRQMGPAPMPGMPARVLIAPESPQRSVLYSFGE